MTRNDESAAATPQHMRETEAALQHNARQTQRSLRSLGGLFGAIARDGGLALIGFGDLAVRLVRDLPRAGGRLGAYALHTIRALPSEVGEGFEQLCERGQEVVAQLRHDPDVQTAIRRTERAGRRTRQAVRSMRRAAAAQASGARHSAAALGRKATARYRHMTVDDLRAAAARHDIDGRSQMRKDELIAALRR